MYQNNKKYLDLRSQYPVFCYENFDYQFDKEKINIAFYFTIGDQISFCPKLQIFPRSFYQFDSLSKEQLDILIFHIGMIELVSYWKCACPPKVKIKPALLAEKQISFFKKLYFNGLGEFFYLNGIETSLDDFMQIESVSEKILSSQRFKLQNECIIPIGGGKDSVVTLELLQKEFSAMPMIINPREASVSCVKESGFSMEDTIEVKRTIDPKLLELNEEGFLNGHTPFSAMLAFVSLLCSAAVQKKHIALSNESSANESTVLNSSINHQYSKSLEFEIDFRSYTSAFISPDFNYFSFLRPLSELQISSLFARYPKYFPVFKSCNAGSKTDIWCGNCPKCLFTFIILSPFIDPEKMEAIFGRNLLDDNEMQVYFDELTGKAAAKPFECVGTIEEIQAALILAKYRFYKDTENIPRLLKNIKIKEENVKQAERLLQIVSQDHCLEIFFWKILKQNI